MCSRILGLVRDMICAFFFSTTVWHYFVVAWRIPNLFRRLFGEGALSSALIPVYTEKLEDNPKSAQALVNSVLTLLIIIIALIILLGEGLIYLFWHFSSQEPKSYVMLTLAAIMLPYVLMVCMVAALGGILHVHRRFAAPAAAPILLNLCWITAVVFFRKAFGESPWRQIYVIAVMVLVAGYLQLFLQILALHRSGIHLKLRFQFSDESVRKVTRLMAPMIVGLAAVQINTLIDDLIALFLSATPERGDTFSLLGYTIAYPVREGSVAHLYYAQRLYQLPLGVFGIALASAVFPFLSTAAVRKDLKEYSQILNQGIRLVLFIALPATIGLILVRTPLIKLIFQRGEFTAEDTQRTSWTLLFYTLGMIAYFLQHLIVRAYYSFQDSVTPVKIAVRVIGLHILLNLVLIWFLGTGGLALSTALCAALQAGILMVILVRRHHLHITDNLSSSLVKTILATGVMAVGGFSIMHFLAESPAWKQVLIVVPACAVIFALSSRILKNPELHELLCRK
jgi:putative peptidoglycan lipid II flippase